MNPKISRLFYFQQTLILILIIVLNNLSSAEVDFDRPNLRGYKLKSAKSKQQTSESIVDLASGAKYLHESLFVEDKIVRCSSYAHLFKIIKQQQQQNSILGNKTARNLERIKRNEMEALAITFADQKELYETLFEKELRTTVPENFLEATKLLETPAFFKDDHAKGAWLDLISCMSNYMKNYGKIRDPAIVEFLQKEERRESLLELEKKERNYNSNVPITSGLVAYIGQKYSGDTKDGRSIYGRYISNKVLDESSKLVATFDDEMTQKARLNYLNKHSFDDSNINKSNKGKSSDFLEDKMNGVKKPFRDDDDIGESNQRNLISASPSSSLKAEFDESKMALLESIKMQLEDLENNQKVDMNSAIDFLVYFEDLNSVELDPTSDLGRKAITFQQEPVNRKLLARVKAVIYKYVHLVSILAELKIQEDRWESVDSDLIPQLHRLDELLESFDPAFDVEQIKQGLSVWKAKCSEYAAVHQFIKTDTSSG